jgi:hypothetical protein
MKRANLQRSIQPLLRAITVISSVAVLATGVTFAALQSQNATLTGNSISTATADLRIGTSATTFSPSRTGFSFGNVIPGGPAAPVDGNIFYLKNYGTPTLALKVAVPTAPANTSGVDLKKVYVVLTRVDTTASQKLPLDSLVTASGGTALTDTLAGVTVAQYKVQIQMDADAFTGQSADITGIDLVFSGSAVTQ